MNLKQKPTKYLNNSNTIWTRKLVTSHINKRVDISSLEKSNFN